MVYNSTSTKFITNFLAFSSIIVIIRSILNIFDTLKGKYGSVENLLLTL